MANFISDVLKNGIWAAGEYAFASKTMNYGLIDEGTDIPVSTDSVRSDITGGAFVASTANLASKTVGTLAVGTIDAANPVASAVSGATVEGLLLLENSGAAGNDDLWAYWNTGVTGLPATPNGGDITVQINASGIITVS